MKPFTLPPWRKRQINEKFKRKDRVISFAVKEMEKVMAKAVDEIYAHYQARGEFVAPTLNGMFAVSESFYRKVVEQSYYAAQDEKNAQLGKKKLAKAPPKIPAFTAIARASLPGMEKVFRDKRLWPKIMKRSEMLTNRLRRQYTLKLRRKFNDIIPALRAGELSPKDAKDHLMKAWKASESRVETIFRTETTNYFGRTQVAFFEDDEDIIGFLFDSIRDKARTPICRTRHGLVYKPGTKELRENTPSLHWNCRSHLIALANTPSNRKLVADPQRDPTKKTVAPLPSGWRK